MYLKFFFFFYVGRISPPFHAYVTFIIETPCSVPSMLFALPHFNPNWSATYLQMHYFPSSFIKPLQTDLFIFHVIVLSRKWEGKTEGRAEKSSLHFVRCDGKERAVMKEIAGALVMVTKVWPFNKTGESGGSAMCQPHLSRGHGCPLSQCPLIKSVSFSLSSVYRRCFPGSCIALFLLRDVQSCLSDTITLLNQGESCTCWALQILCQAVCVFR